MIRAIQTATRVATGETLKVLPLPRNNSQSGLYGIPMAGKPLTRNPPGVGPVISIVKIIPSSVSSQGLNVDEYILYLLTHEIDLSINRIAEDLQINPKLLPEIYSHLHQIRKIILAYSQHFEGRRLYKNFKV